MEWVADPARTDGVSVGAGEWTSVDDYRRLLRFSHTLGSLLREILEDRFLAEACPLHLSRVQFCFLKLVTLLSDPAVGEVGRRLGVSAAAASKTVDRLEALGLLARMPCPGDRRVTRVRPTSAGHRLVADFERIKSSRVAPVMSSLGDERCRELCDLLEEVCVGLMAGQPRHRGACLRCSGYFDPDCSIGRMHGECALAVATPATGEVE
jgi:MarR family 2-MHQ and catechol resistance regulon transcriptional repressor